MRSFHFLDAVCLFVVAAFILLAADAQPKTSNTKLKNKGPTSSGNAKPNPDALPKTTTSNTKLENEPAKQKNSGLTLGNRWDSVASDEGLKLSEPDQLIVEYPGQNYGARSVSAEQPISKNKLGFFYYEVEILAHKGNSIAIGLGPTKPIPLQEEIGRVKGYAYNSGGIVQGHNVAGSSDFKGRPYIYEKPRFGVREVVGDDGVRNVVRDVVGCGVNLAKRQIFYTLNGALLETLDMNAADLDADLFPSVSMDYPGNKIEANFGSKKFKFDRANAF